MASAVFIGVDVSKAKVDVAAHKADFERCVPRTVDGLARLAHALKELNVERVVLEASGGYEQLVLQVLHAEGLPVVLVEAGRARHFAKSMGRYAKSDSIDARVLAKMAEFTVDDVPLWQPRTEEEQALRDLVRRRRQLVVMTDAERKRLAAATNASCQRSSRRLLEVQASEVKRVEREIRELVKRSDALRVQVDELTAVVGVGLVTAVTLVAELPELGSLTRREAASLAGVAPMNRDSGEWSGERYIRGGRADVRRALYMAALVGIQRNPHLSEKYRALVERGKPKKVALVAVMRKLLVHLNARMRRLKETTAA